MGLTRLNNQALPTLDSGKLPSGTVLQVKQSVLDASSYHSGTMTHISGLDVAITPTASNSKFLIRGQFSISAVARYHVVKLYRRINSADTQIAMGDNGSNTSRPEVWLTCGTGESTNTTYEQQPVFGEFLDSPNTTSAITYKVEIGSYTTHAFGINTAHYGSGSYNAIWNQAPTCTLTVMEIAG